MEKLEQDYKDLLAKLEAKEGQLGNRRDLQGKYACAFVPGSARVWCAYVSVCLRSCLGGCACLLHMLLCIHVWVRA